MTVAGRKPSRLVDGLYARSAAGRLKARCQLRTVDTIDRMLAFGGHTRPLVFVSGFWRSGTTWLQECLAEALQAKTVFEPLSPQHGPARALLGRRFDGDEDLLQASLPGMAAEDEASVQVLMTEAMRGVGGTPFALSCRTTLGEALCRGVVVKDVRAQCLLPALHDRFRMPVIHLRRHPCAVAASLFRANWHWSFERVRLSQLFAPTTLDKFEPDQRRAFDADALARIAFVWAWSERRAAESLAGQSWGRVVSYEALIADPDGLFPRLCASLNLKPVKAVAFDVPSASVAPEDFAGRARTGDGWRSKLSAGDADRILSIVDSVYSGWSASETSGIATGWNAPLR